MNEFDFDKNFGRDLGNERPFEPSEPGWEKVAARLDALETRRPRPWKALLWVPVLAGLAVLGFLGRALQRSERRAGELESEVGRLRSELSAARTVSRTDTLHRQVTVVRYDTVYRRILLPDHSAAWDGMAAGATRQRSGDSLRSPAVSAHKNLPETDDYPDLRSRDIFPGRPALTPVAPERPDHDGAGARVAFLPPAGKSRLEYLQELRLPNQGLLMVSVPQETPYRKLARRFRAQHLAIGTMGGVLFPHTAGANSLIAYQMGPAAEWTLGPHLRLRGGVEYGLSRFGVKTSAYTDFQIPPLTPPTPFDVFENVEVKQPFLDFTLQLRYVVAMRHGLFPFASVAWASEKTLKQTLQYEFNNQLTGEDTYVQVTRPGTRFTANGLQLGLGTEWQLGPYTIQVEGVYQRQFAEAVPLLAERWGIKTGAFYYFSR